MNAVYERSSMVQEQAPTSTSGGGAIDGAMQDMARAAEQARAATTPPKPQTKQAPTLYPVSAQTTRDSAPIPPTEQERRLEMIVRQRNAGITNEHRADAAEALAQFARDPRLLERFRSSGLAEDPAFIRAWAEVARLVRYGIKR